MRTAALRNIALFTMAAGLGPACGHKSIVTGPEGSPVDTNPSNTWVHCLCHGCVGPQGQPLGDNPVGGCSTIACPNANGFTPTCAQVCANYAMTQCVSTGTDPNVPCEATICDQCSSTTACPTVSGVDPSQQPQCFLPGNVCGTACTAANAPTVCSACGECSFASGANTGVCTPLAGGTQCGGHGSVPNYLDLVYGRYSFTVDTTSTFTVQTSQVSAQGQVGSGSLAIIVRDCPGPNCTMRLNDLAVAAPSFAGTVNDLLFCFPNTSCQVTITDTFLTLVKPTNLYAESDGTFTVLTNSMQVVFGFTGNGQRSAGNIVNLSDLSGFVDPVGGLVHFAGSFNDPSTGTTIGVSLDGHALDVPPKAVAGSYPPVECSSPAGGSLALDGTGSTTTPPGAPIDQYLWLSDLDPRTGNATLLTTGANPTITLPLGSHALTLEVIDTEGSLGLDPTQVDVVDNVPPTVDEQIARGCLWPPNQKLVRYDLGTDIAVVAFDPCVGDLTGSVKILDVVSDQPPVGLGSGNTPEDVFFNGTALCIRSERSATLGNRTYTVTVGVVGPTGTPGQATAQIVVPHDLGQAPSKCDPVRPADFIDDGDPRCHLPATVPSLPRPIAGPASKTGFGCSSGGNSGPAAVLAVGLAAFLCNRRFSRRAATPRARP